MTRYLLSSRPFLLLVLILPAVAAAETFELETPGAIDIQEPEPWQEQEVALPPYPAEDDLVAVTSDRLRAGMTLELDRRHLAVGNDGVVRYTVVVASARGARNVFFEGIDCRERRYKTYAYGHGGRTLRSRTNPQWERIPLRGTRSFRKDLSEGYFCERFGHARSRGDIMDRLDGAMTLDF